MGLGKWTGRPARVGALLAAGAIGGAAAVAVAAVPGSDGVIHACYELAKGETTPATVTGNVRIIDPSAGQTCNPPAGIVPALSERAISWNVAGPPGQPGTPGAPGQPGAQGAPGQTVTVAGQTFTLGNGKALTVGSSAVPPLQAKPGGRPVATITLGSGGSAISFGVQAWQLVGNGAGAGAGSGVARPQVHDIQVMKQTDKASPKLFQYCVRGQHIKQATITLRKAGKGPQEFLVITLKNVLISSYQTGASAGGGGGSKPTERVSLNFTEIKYTYTEQKP